MEELDLSSNRKRRLKVKFSEEESYEVRLPSMFEARDFQKQLKKTKDEGDQIDLMVEFLSQLGLPKNRVGALDVLEMDALKDKILNLKKN